MPWGDRTGPLGLGPRTGRGLGYCSGFDSPGFAKGPGWGFGRGWVRGRGFGRGWGRGRGWRWFWAMNYFPEEILPPDDEKKLLQEEAEFLKRRLAEIEKRMKKLEEEK
ncbi:DUF5320 domain-containing protein [Thermodesulfobacterium hydrogeniphilum]|uniref:DUF5320 domain-containing protein n=1 Tax=Thermodesulfobacterium hydrogeniphilum TaxID=161156 RepID=UPI00056EC67E|nr:DUF5320 domain-containing protein [Thermodesulfobacterium hydrogeniphilum]